ncbi:MAG: hypothetical protein ABW042_01300 [Phenylobacterium sp.]
MNRRIVFEGASGAEYSYQPLSPEERLRPLAGNYVIARLSGGRPMLIAAGETDNLSKMPWQDLLSRAVILHGATDILVRLNVRGVIRQQELEDLLDAYHPPMAMEQAA